MIDIGTDGKNFLLCYLPAEDLWHCANCIQCTVLTVSDGAAPNSTTEANTPLGTLPSGATYGRIAAAYATLETRNETFTIFGEGAVTAEEKAGVHSISVMDRTARNTTEGRGTAFSFLACFASKNRTICRTAEVTPGVLPSPTGICPALLGPIHVLESDMTAWCTPPPLAVHTLCALSHSLRRRARFCCREGDKELHASFAKFSDDFFVVCRQGCIGTVAGCPSNSLIHGRRSLATLLLMDACAPSEGER